MKDMQLNIEVILAIGVILKMSTAGYFRYYVTTKLDGISEVCVFNHIPISSMQWFPIGSFQHTFLFFHCRSLSCPKKNYFWNRYSAFKQKATSVKVGWQSNCETYSVNFMSCNLLNPPVRIRIGVNCHKLFTIFKVWSTVPLIDLLQSLIFYKLLLYRHYNCVKHEAIPS
jgi:hypothetical protein